MSTPLDQVLGRLGVRKPERGQYDDIIERHAATHDLDPDFVRAVIGKESAGKPGAVSPKGARGLMQLMPATAARLGVRDVHDPDQNIGGGTRYLRKLLDRFDGDVPLALAGYNAGEGAVEKYGRRVPPYRETQDYVRIITSKYKGTGRAQKKEGAPTAPPAAVQTVLDDLDRKSARPAATPQTGNRPDSPGTPKPASYASPAPAAPPQATADSAPAKSSSGLAPGSRPPIETHSAGGQEASVVTAQRVRVAKARRRAAAARVELRKAESTWRQEGLQREYDMMAVRSGNFGGRNPAEVVGRVDSRLAAEEARRRYDEATAAHRRERDKLKGMKVAPARPNIASDFESLTPPPNAPPLVVTSDKAGSYRSDDILQDVDAGVSRAAAREVAARAEVVNETALREQVRRRVVFEQGGEENLARIKRDALLTEAIRAGVAGEELEKYVADRMGAPHSIDRHIEEQTATEVERLKQTDAYAKQMAATGRPADVADWWRDLKNRPFQLVPFIGSLPDIANILHLRDASARFERGNADEEDKIALREFRALNQAHPTVANRILSIVTQLPAFAGELALTSGSYGAVKEAAEAGIRKALTREGVSLLEHKAGDTLTRRALTRAGEFGVKAASATAGSVAQTPMAGSLRIVQGANEHMLTRGEDAGTAFGWALVDQFIETATEHAGGVTEFIPGVSKLSKGAKRFTRPIERAGVHDIIGEMTEERLGELARAVVGLQPDFTLMGVPLKDYATAHGWAEAGKQLVAEAVGFSVPGAAHAAAAGFPAAPAEAEVAPVDGGPAEVGENVVNKSAAPASVDERVAASETGQPPEQRAPAQVPAIPPQPTEGGGAHETVTPVPVASALDANGSDRNTGVATLGTETQTKQEGGGATATGAATDSLGFKEAFGSARNAVSDSFIDDAWARLSAGRDLLFADKPGTVEQKLQQAAADGQIGSRDDVARIVGEHYGRTTPATETTPVVAPSAPAGLQSQEKLSPVKGKPPTRAQSTGIRRRPSFDPSAHDLTGFVISNGGIRVDKDKANRGELARFFRVRPGLINNKSGRSVEDMAREAAAAGFRVGEDGGYAMTGTLDKAAGVGEADPNVFLDMLDDDARGLRKYYTAAKEEVDAEFERRASEEPELSAVDAAIDRALESDENFSSLMSRVLYHGSDSLSADELQELRARGIAHGLSAEVEDTISTHSDLLTGAGEISEAGLDAGEGEVDFDPTEFEDETRTDEAAAGSRSRPAEVSPEDGTAARGLERAPAEGYDDEIAFARPDRAQPSMLEPAGGLFGGPQESAHSPTKHPADIQREQLAEKERERQSARLREAFGDDGPEVERLSQSGDKLVRAVASKVLERAPDIRESQSSNFKSFTLPLQKLADLREQGVSVDEYARQGSMFDTGLDQEQMTTLRAFASGHAEARINQLLSAPTDKSAASVEDTPGGPAAPLQAQSASIEPPAAEQEGGADDDVEVEDVAFKKGETPRGWESADTSLTVNRKPQPPVLVEFRPPTKGAPDGFVVVNNRAISLLTGLFGQQVEGAGGLYLTPALASQAVSQLEALSLSLRGGGHKTAAARGEVDTLRRVISEARMASKDGAVEFVNEGGRPLGVRKQLRRHEATHRAQVTASGGALFSQQINNELYAAHPLFETVREALLKKGYADRVHTIASEATAYIASGDWEGLGLTREQGKELLGHYFNLLTMRWGSRAAEVFRKIHPYLVEARDEAKREAERREAAGLEPTGRLQPGARERTESARSVPEGAGGVRPDVRRDVPAGKGQDERIAASREESAMMGDLLQFGPRRLPFGYSVKELSDDHQLREYGDTHGVFSPSGEMIISGASYEDARDAGLEYFRITGDPGVRANQKSALRELDDIVADGARDSFRVVKGDDEASPALARDGNGVASPIRWVGGNRGVGAATEMIAFRNLPAEHVEAALEGTGATRYEADEPMLQRGQEEAAPDRNHARRELRRAALIRPTRERSFPKTLEAAGFEGGADRTYEVYSNQLALEDAQELLDEKGVEGAAEYLQSVEDWGPEHTALSYLVLSKVDGARAVQVASTAARALTRQGQAIQAAQIISRLAPERVAVTASRIAEAAGVRITPEQLDEFTQLAREAQDADERARELQAKAEEALKAATSADGEIEKLEAQLESQRRQLHRALEAEERNEELEKKVANLQAQLRRLKDEREAKKPVRAGSGGRRGGVIRARAGTLQHRLEQIEREARARLAARKSGDIAANFTVKGKDGERGASPIPLDIADWSIIGAAKLVRNGLDFAGWSAEVLSDLGEDVRPHLRLVYHRSLQTLQQERATLRRQRSERAGLRRAVEEGLDPDSVTADELARLIADAEDAASERARRTQELARALAAIEPKGLIRRIFDAATDAVGAPRSLMSSGDMPPLLRQGLLLSLMHPRRAGSAFFRAIAAGMHGKTYDDIVQEIKAHPRFREMRRVKLYLATIANERNEGISDVAALAAREEQFSSRLVSKLPWVKFSARNFNAFADLMRVFAYTSFAEYLESHGLNSREDRKQFEAAASFVNVTSGRGTLGRQVDQALPFLSLFGFSPRFLVARAETPFIPLTYPARAAAHSYWQLGKAGVALGAAMVLLSLVPGVSIQWWPPDDADWLKVKIGDKRWDLLGGFQQPFRFAYRVAANITARQQGKKLSRGEEPGEIVLRFLRSKTSPQASYVWDLVSGETADFDEKTGKPEKFEWLGHLFDTDGRFNPGNGILGRLAPMSPREVYKGYLKDGAAGAAAASPSMIGAGTSNYHKAERTEVPETVQGWYERLGVKAPEPGRKMKVEGRDYEMSPAEYEAYRKDVEREAFERLQRLFEPKDDAAREKLGRYEALSEDEQKEAVHAIHRDAAEAARSRFKRALDGPGAVRLPEVVGAELSRLEMSEPEGGAKVTVAGREFELTAEQRKRYTEALRAEAYKRLERLFALDGYRPLSDERKRKRVERVVELAQTQARAAMREELMPGNRRIAAEDRRAARRAGRTDESDVLRRSERREERQRRRYGLQ